MTITRRDAFIVCLIVSLAGSGVGRAHAEGSPSCTLTKIASLDAITENGELLIPVKLNGRDSQLRVDTGSPYSMISKGLAKELKLAEESTAYRAAIDASGAVVNHYVTIAKVELGGMSATRIPFLVMGERSAGAVGYDGVFGADFLAAYDVELDLAHGKLNLFLQDHCSGQVVYWTQDYVSVPFELDASLHPIIRVSLDGEDLTAMLDTGATPSTLSTLAARRHFNLDPEGDGTKPDGEVQTASGAALPYYRHLFSKFEIGGVEFHKTEFDVMRDKNARDLRQRDRLDVDPQHQQPKNIDADIVLGLHHLSKLRVYVAYREHTLYISRADAN